MRHVVIQVVALAVIAGVGISFLGRGATTAPPAISTSTLPIVELAKGHAGIDHAAWVREFTRLDLPDPPALQGGDPVPIERLASAVAQWAESRSSDALGTIGSIYLAMEEQEAAAMVFAGAVEMAPEDPRWTYLLGASCEALGLDDAAERILDRAAELDPSYATTFARLGALRLRAGELDEAEAAYRAYVALEPRISLGHTGLGVIAMERGDTRRAVSHLTAAVSATPNDFLACRHLARALAAAGKSDEARRIAARADSLPQYSGWLSFDPRLQEVHELARTQRHLENSIRLAMSESRFSDLATLMPELLARRPNDAEMRGRYAAVCARLGRNDEAHAQIQQAIQAAPSSVSLRVTAAELAMSTGDMTVAGQAVDAILALDSASARGHDLRGRLHYARGDFESALADWRNAIALGGNEPDIRLAMATTHFEQERWDDALEEVDRILAAQPNQLQAASLRARILARRNNP